MAFRVVWSLVGCATPKSRARIDGAELSIGRRDPPRFVAHGPHAIARQLRHEHGEIGLAGGARHGGREIRDPSVRVLDAEDQHVLGEPALLARLPGAEAEGVALLAEQRVAAIARADAPDQALLGKMRDEAAVRREVAEGMRARDEVLAMTHVRERALSHPGHHVHARDDVGAVGDLTPTRLTPSQPVHQIRDNVHGAPAHRPLSSRRRADARPPGQPVLGGPASSTDGSRYRELFGARHVARIARCK